MRVDEMPAGREMDALVAEKGMGWKQHPAAKPLEDWYYNPPWPIGVTGFKPSTDIAAAWEVVRKMGELGYTCVIQWRGASQIYTERAEILFIKGTYTAGHAAGDVTGAICVAALKAMGVMEC